MNADWTGRNRVDLTLTHDDAVVLSDVLRRWRDDGTLQHLPFQDSAEAILLTDLLGAVESVLDETTAENYLPALREARERVRDRRGSTDAPASALTLPADGERSHV